MKIAGMTVKAGTIGRGSITTGGFADGVAARIPVIVAAGAKPGKTLAVLAAQHGRELNGIAGVYKALGSFQPRKMHGVVIFFPVCNPLGVRMQVQDFPTERSRALRAGPDNAVMNLNRQWPGKRNGSLPQQIASAIWHAGVKDADCVFDLHGWSATSTSLAWGPHSSLALLEAMGFPWYETHDKKDAHPAQLESACSRNGNAYVICELAPQNIVTPVMVERAHRGICNLAKHLGIIPGELDRPETQYRLDYKKIKMVKAQRSGLLVVNRQPGQVIAKNEAAGELVDLETLRRVQTIAPPRRMMLRSIGCCWGTGELDYNVVREGERVAMFCDILRTRGAGG